MLNDLEYTFFDTDIAERFCEQVHAHGLTTSMAEDDVTGEVSYVIKIEGEVPDDKANLIEEMYSDMLFGEQAAQIEGNEDGAIADSCGVQIQLSNGEFTTVAIHPTIMNKILSVLSIDELQKFLAQVAEDIENPKQGPICRRENLPEV